MALMVMEEARDDALDDGAKPRALATTAKVIMVRNILNIYY